jgi:Flp pilus assembly protein TadB
MTDNRPRWARVLAPTSPVPVLAGVLVSAVGFILIAVAWAEVAGVTDVALQMPYLVSAGLTGLGLVMVGLLVINVAVKRQDAAERRRQMEQLTEVLRELKGIGGDR